MKPPQPRRKCLHCKELFLPDYRGGQRQCYCLKPDCRKARKRELMRAWLAKPENQNYFRDDGNAQRARDWQKDHHGYWKNTTRHRRRTLQDGCQQQVPAAQEVAKNAPDCTLQDLCSMQVPLLVGLISMFVGSTLQDDIATSARCATAPVPPRLRQKCLAANVIVIMPISTKLKIVRNFVIHRPICFLL